MEEIFHFVILMILMILPTAGLCFLYSKKQSPKKESVQVPVGLISGYEEEGAEERLLKDPEVPDNELFDNLVDDSTTISLKQDDPASNKPLSTLLRELDDIVVNQNIGSNTVLMIRAPHDFKRSKTHQVSSHRN